MDEEKLTVVAANVTATLVAAFVVRDPKAAEMSATVFDLAHAAARINDAEHAEAELLSMLERGTVQIFSRLLPAVRSSIATAHRRFTSTSPSLGSK